MKRILSLFAALLLLFSCAAAEVETELNGIHIYGNKFAINYPEEWGVNLDDSANTPDDLYCGMLYSPLDTGLNVEIYMYYLEDWADYTMVDVSVEELASYNEMFLEIYAADLGYSSIGVVYTTRDGIPFLLYNAADEYGPMYVAECMMNGWFITLYGYAYEDSTYVLCRDLDEADLNLFSAIVETYAPMTLGVPAE